MMQMAIGPQKMLGERTAEDGGESGEHHRRAARLRR
jgi:hypothetical protein